MSKPSVDTIAEDLQIKISTEIQEWAKQKKVKDEWVPSEKMQELER